MPGMIELILTLKIPDKENQALRFFNDAYRAKFPNSSCITNSTNNISNNYFPISCIVWNV